VLFPSVVILGTVVAIAIAGLALVVTRTEVPQRGAILQAATPARPTPSADVSLPPAIFLAPEIKRDRVRVDIFNSSDVAGLADRTAARADKRGWRVQGIGNWAGGVPTSTVYYPPGLRLEATVLADDLGVRRFRAAVAPMRTDRLTVILTGN
jgi:LytR cell envelope-related transcriptional attenuator